MSGALELALGVPLWIGYIVSAVMVIPLVTHGVRLISRFQILTQPFWIVLNILPFVFIAFSRLAMQFDVWRAFAGIRHASGPPGTIAPFDLMEFGAASAVILALMSQIGEQADFLRFLPPEGHRKLPPPAGDLPRRARLGADRRAEAPRRFVPGGTDASAPASPWIARRTRPKCISPPSATCCPGTTQPCC